jgi:Mo-dependent nitrogenase C-terminus
MRNLFPHLLQSARQWLDTREIRNRHIALLLSKTIPSQCPFARNITIFGFHLLHIPPLCKLNPFYDQLVGLRFRALCYLVDDCGMNIEVFS